MNKRVHKSKNQDLFAAVEQMQQGDPPLRWKAGEVNAFSMKQSLHRRFPGELHLFIWNDEVWIIKLTPPNVNQQSAPPLTLVAAGAIKRVNGS